MSPGAHLKLVLFGVLFRHPGSEFVAGQPTRIARHEFSWKVLVSEPAKILLAEDEIPSHWYNVQADLERPVDPALHPGTIQPAGPDDFAPLFPMALVGRKEEEVARAMESVPVIKGQT